jgi:hypothetical protein
MPYIINKTNGEQLTVVDDASLDLTTDLTFVGRNYAGYGEVQNENFLKLLENFANTSEPPKPIQGQLWYDKNTERIAAYNGASWKRLPNIEVKGTDPSGTKEFNAGDFWYDSTEEQLYAYNGSSFSLVGPPTGADTRAQWRGSYEYSVAEGSSAKKYNVKAVLGSNNEVIAVVSDETYEILTDPTSDSFPMSPITSKIYKGITLAGADPITGVSGTTSTGVILWGTAAHSLLASTATFALSTQGVTVTNNTNTNDTFFMVFSTGTGATSLNVDTSGITYNPSSNTLATTIFAGTATSAYYADLAERYEADAVYEPGTVLVIGGEKEVTITSIFADTRVAGIVSKNPAYMMNSGAGTDETHPYIALKGRVPCKVIGPISKGDLLVTSAHPGYACVGQNVFSGAVIGKALGNQSEGFGVVEVLVV